MKQKKTQLMIMFQLLSEAYNPDEYEYTKKSGYLGESVLTTILHSYEGLMEIPHDFPRNHTKVSSKFGLLSKKDNGTYEILSGSPKNTLGAGFYLEIWNNQQNIGKNELEKMISKVTNLIEEKYSNYVEMLYQTSW